MINRTVSGSPLGGHWQPLIGCQSEILGQVIIDIALPGLVNAVVVTRKMQRTIYIYIYIYIHT